MTELSFEDAMTRIETIVNQLKDEQISLKDSLEFYKEAVGLLSFCNEELKTAQLVVEEYRLKEPVEGMGIE